MMLLPLAVNITACEKSSEKQEDINAPAKSTITNEKLYYFTNNGVYLNTTKISDLKPSTKAVMDDANNIYDFNTRSVLKNGIPISTPNSVSYSISCFYIDGTDIYAGGNESQTISGHFLTRPAYWKNGIKMPLELDNWSDGVFTHEVTDIKKYNNQIFLSGVTKISNLAVPPYNVLWNGGKFDYTANYSQYYAYQKPITINGKLIFVSKGSNGQYGLNLTNGSVGSDWFDVSTAFSFSSAEFNGTAYPVYTRIFKDVGYLGCRSGDIALPVKMNLISCTFNGKDEYVCLSDGANFNGIYKNGQKISPPTILSNINITKVISK